MKILIAANALEQPDVLDGVCEIAEDRHWLAAVPRIKTRSPHLEVETLLGSEGELLKDWSDGKAVGPRFTSVSDLRMAVAAFSVLSDMSDTEASCYIVDDGAVISTQCDSKDRPDPVLRDSQAEVPFPVNKASKPIPELSADDGGRGQVVHRSRATHRTILARLPSIGQVRLSASLASRINSTPLVVSLDTATSRAPFLLDRLSANRRGELISAPQACLHGVPSQLQLGGV